MLLLHPDNKQVLVNQPDIVVEDKNQESAGDRDNNKSEKRILERTLER